MEDEKLINSALANYSTSWKIQEETFKSINEPNPYPSPTEIIIEELTVDEKNKIIKTLKVPNSQAFRQISDITIKKFGQKHLDNVTLSRACSKLNYKIYKQIPKKDTCSLKEFYYSIPTKLNISPEELVNFYKLGYLPHISWNNGEPRFNNRMWFILDFNIREAKKELGNGFIFQLNQWKPKWYVLKQYMELTVFMYNSWNLGDAILEYCDKKARISNLKGDDFKNFRRGLIKSMWCKEGKTISLEIIKQCCLSNNLIDLTIYYRDIFALLSFESFPTSYLIDLYEKPNQRMAVMFSYQEFAKISVHNMDIGNINTYKDENLSMKYGFLFSAIEWALSMSEGVESKKVIEIISLYRLNQDRHSKKIPCKICGKLFKPKRPKYDVTCGNKNCIIDNKKLSKRKDPWSFPPLLEM